MQSKLMNLISNSGFHSDPNDYVLEAVWLSVYVLTAISLLFPIYTISY